MPIELYLIRHGIAADPLTYPQDQDRPLTEKGRTKTQAIAQRLKQLGLSFDELLTSPLLRARQTAEILLEASLTPALTVTDTLAPQGSMAEWLAWLQTWRQGERTTLALVGHEPDLSQWAEILLWGEARGVLQLKKAGLIGLTLPDEPDPVGNSSLFWLAPPRFML